MGGWVGGRAVPCSPSQPSPAPLLPLPASPAGGIAAAGTSRPMRTVTQTKILPRIRSVMLKFRCVSPFVNAFFFFFLIYKAYVGNEEFRAVPRSRVCFYSGKENTNVGVV